MRAVFANGRDGLDAAHRETWGGFAGEHLNQAFARQRLVFTTNSTNAHLGRA